jgi:hypothetical protein
MFVHSPSGSIFEDIISQWSERISMTQISHIKVAYIHRMKHLQRTPNIYIQITKGAIITFQTACKFPGIACRVQPWVIHLIHGRWQIACNLLSRASVTVRRTVAAPCRTRCASIVPVYWVTGSHLVTRMEYRENILVKATFQLRPRQTTWHEKLEKTCSILDERGEHRR